MIKVRRLISFHQEMKLSIYSASPRPIPFVVLKLPFTFVKLIIHMTIKQVMKFHIYKIESYIRINTVHIFSLERRYAFE